MYQVEKRFKVPIGHRLIKHMGRCKNYHGHNFVILVGLSAETLNDNDMVMDFSDIKVIVNRYLDTWDHSMLLNVIDDLKVVFEDSFRVITFPFDPTVERLSEVLFIEIKSDLKNSNVNVDYVTIYENEDSKATYCRRDYD